MFNLNISLSAQTSEGGCEVLCVRPLGQKRWHRGHASCYFVPDLH